MVIFVHGISVELHKIDYVVFIHTMSNNSRLTFRMRGSFHLCKAQQRRGLSVYNFHFDAYFSANLAHLNVDSKRKESGYEVSN